MKGKVRTRIWTWIWTHGRMELTFRGIRRLELFMEAAEMRLALVRTRWKRLGRVNENNSCFQDLVQKRFVS